MGTDFMSKICLYLLSLLILLNAPLLGAQVGKDNSLIKLGRVKYSGGGD